MKLLKAIWASVLASRADSLASARNRRPAEALNVLERAYKVLELSVPSDAAPVDWNIIASQIAIDARKASLALACCDVALKQIRSGRSGYAGDDRKYVEAFCLILQDYCLVWRDGKSAMRADAAPDFDLGKVRPYLKWRFRMPPDDAFLASASDASRHTLH